MPGTYIAIRVHPESERVISEFCKCKGIQVNYPNLERRRHVTLFSSDADFSAAHREVLATRPEDLKYYAAPDGWAVFPTQNNTNGLVLKLICPQLVEYNKNIGWQYNATDRYAEFRLHCTFTYDMGTLDMTKIPAFVAPLILCDEYVEEYKDNWSAK